MPKTSRKIINIDIKDNSREVLETMHKQVEMALQAIGLEAEGYAKGDSPVDTGRLRNSITWATNSSKGAGSGADSSPKATPEKDTVYVGTNVEYAEYQEYGDYHHTVGKKHFLRDSMATHADHYKSILEAALKS